MEGGWEGRRKGRKVGGRAGGRAGGGEHNRTCRVNTRYPTTLSAGRGAAHRTVTDCPPPGPAGPTSATAAAIDAVVESIAAADGPLRSPSPAGLIWRVGGEGGGGERDEEGGARGWREEGEKRQTRRK